MPVLHDGEVGGGLLQAFDGIGDLGVQRRGEHEDAIAVRALLLLGTHRDRHLRHERVDRKLVVPDQPLPHGTGAQGNDDVVHGGAVSLLQRLDALEIELAEHEPAVCGHLAVEGRSRCLLGRADDPVAVAPDEAFEAVEQTSDPGGAGDDREDRLIEIGNGARQ